MTPLRIYADYNGIGREPNGRLSIPLDTLGSLRDLSNAGVRLTEGLVLTVVDWSDEEEDLEAEATTEYDAAVGVWLAMLGPAGYRYVPKGDRTADRRFLCLRCRRDLGTADADDSGFPRLQTCPVCGTPINAAIAAPEVAGGHPDPAT
jgi:hypothetical protein